MTVSESIIHWLGGFDPSKMEGIQTDLLASDIRSYSLVKEPIQNVQNFISGKQIITGHYTLMARLAGRTDPARVENSRFGEALETWISGQDRKKNYPMIEGAVVQKVDVTSPFYLGRTQEHDSLYQMTVAIRYMKEN